MPRAVLRQFIRLGFVLLMVGIAVSVHANPNDYPEYARIKIAQNIPVEFITPEDVKQRLDSGTPQMLIDVRKNANFLKSHLPGAVSIPLRTLEKRVGDIPRDTPVVFY